MNSILSCPVCENVLQQDEKRYECVNRHSYDVAREGYVNLLLANQKASKRPGDSRDMLQARRRFLESGHYNILSDAVNRTIYERLPMLRATNILEAGCGEGYYLGQLLQFLTASGVSQSVEFWGLDIAKDAVRMAAKRYQQVNFLVASTRRRIPIVDQSVDLLLTIFAPRNTAEYQRIVAENGVVMIVIPGKNHLQQLRTVLMLPEREATKQDEVMADFQIDFQLGQVETLSDNIELNNAELLDLVQMTPSYWHISSDIWGQLHGITHFETQVEFLMLIFHRNQGNTIS